MTTLDSFAILLRSGKYTTDIELKQVTNSFKLKLLDLHRFKFTSIVIFAPYTAISRKVVAKTVHVTIPKGNMGYGQYTCS